MLEKMNRQSQESGGSSGGTSRRPRGFAAMSANRQREIARKGGQAVSQNRNHMAEIGRKGGEASRGGGRRTGSAQGGSGR